MFRSNQERLCEKLDDMETENTMIPDPAESKTFWACIWDNPVNHNSNAYWLKDVASKLTCVQNQNYLVVTPAMVTKHLMNIAELKAPGHDVQRG